MTPAERNYQRTGLKLRIVRAQLLLQVSGPDRDVSLADLLQFARVVGDETEADSLAAFRAAQVEILRTARAELDQ